MDDETIVTSPSRGRAISATTHNFVEGCHYVVTESEAEQYREAGLTAIGHPEELSGNIAMVRNWILDTYGGSRIVMLDDDITGVLWMQGREKIKMTPEKVTRFIGEAFALAEQWKLPLWGVNPLPDKLAYRDFTPFSTVNYIPATFCGHYQNELRYDESMPLKEDYDMTLQALNRYRGALRFNMVSYYAKHAIGMGGCSMVRTGINERKNMQKLITKWGRDIVRIDGGEKTRKTKQRIANEDINPILISPIKGV